MFSNYNKIILKESSIIFNAIKEIKISFNNILSLIDVDEDFISRKRYYEDVFILNNNNINKEIDIVIDKLHHIRSFCYDDLEKILKLFKMGSEEDLEFIKHSKNIGKLIKGLNDMTIAEKNRNIELAILNENIRFFIHQVMNILSISKPIFANRIFNKELKKEVIIKDNNFVVSKIQANLDQIIKFEKELKGVLTINNENKIQFENVNINEIVDFISIYNDKLLAFPYSRDTFLINLNLKINTKINNLNSNKNKIEEIIDVILNNGCEELCNKDLENKETFSKNINIEIKDDINNLIINIKDNGRGIKNIDKIFEPYFTTKANTGGSGIGLAAAIRLIKSLNGKLKVETELDRGSSFTIILPL